MTEKQTAYKVVFNFHGRRRSTNSTWVEDYQPDKVTAGNGPYFCFASEFDARAWAAETTRYEIWKVEVTGLMPAPQTALRPGSANAKLGMRETFWAYMNQTKVGDQWDEGWYERLEHYGSTFLPRGTVLANSVELKEKVWSWLD